MCDLNPTKQLVELERYKDVRRALAREALLAQLPRRERGAWRRAVGTFGALLVAFGKRLESIGDVEASAYPKIIAQK
jgi:hypothetical protein